MTTRAVITTLALLLAGCVLFAFVSPAFAVPETALRSQQNAVRLLLGLLALFITILPRIARSDFARPMLEAAPVPLSASLVDLTCTRRC